MEAQLKYCRYARSWRRLRPEQFQEPHNALLLLDRRSTRSDFRYCTAQADAVLGCFKFLEGYYLLFATKKRLHGNICGEFEHGSSYEYRGRTPDVQLTLALLQAKRYMVLPALAWSPLPTRRLQTRNFL